MEPPHLLGLALFEFPEALLGRLHALKQQRAGYDEADDYKPEHDAVRLECAQACASAGQIPPWVNAKPACSSPSPKAARQASSSVRSVERMTKFAPTLPSLKKG